MSRHTAVLLSLLLLGTFAFASPATELLTREERRAHDHKQSAQGDFSPTLAALGGGLGPADCVDGEAAGIFPCDGVDLLQFIPATDLPRDQYNNTGSTKIEGSDVWGWTSSATGHEYVLMGKSNGMSIFRIERPEGGTPTLAHLGELPNPGTGFVVWQDIKVHADHAYVVSETRNHFLQVLDLTQLDGLEADPDRRFTETFLERSSDSQHNIAINTDTGFAYVVGGSKTDLVEDVLCRSGLDILDLSDPANPVDGGCFPGDLYVHDAQCVVYHGPDELFQGRELCFNANEDWVSIVDVTDKANPVRINLLPYPQSAYVHQGWLTEDHRFFLLGDEADETRFGSNTRTMIFDFSESLLQPQLPVEHYGPTRAIDHNMYVKDGLVYQSNYAAGLRILDTAGLYEGTPSLEEIAFFDVFPDHDQARFVGTWSNYPWFADGVVAVNAYDGIFLLQVHESVREAHERDVTPQD